MATIIEPLRTHVERDTAGSAGASLLTPDVAECYGGPLRFPAVPATRPYTFGNFVESMDGVVSFHIPGRASGGEVSMFNAQDQYVMAVLRAIADAVMVGAKTLRAEPRHTWTPNYIFPKGAEHWRALRTALGRTGEPTNTFVTNSGNVDLTAAVFHAPGVRCIVCTTTAGAERVRTAHAAHLDAHVEVLVVGNDHVELPRMLETLRTTCGIERLLVEGGPTLMGDFVAAELMDEVFLTDAPQVIGNDGTRPTWAKGHPFTPETAPQCTLISLKGWGDYVFRRYRFLGERK